MVNRVTAAARTATAHPQGSRTQRPDAPEVADQAGSAALRMETVEPVFGQIKQGRGFRQFLLWGLEKVQGEWSLICAGHNLLKLFHFGGPAHGKGLQPHILTAGLLPGQHSIRGTARSVFYPPWYQALSPILGRAAIQCSCTIETHCMSFRTKGTSVAKPGERVGAAVKAKAPDTSTQRD